MKHILLRGKSILQFILSPLLGAGQVSQREGRPAPQDQEQPQGEAQEEQEKQEEEVPERLRRVGGGQRLRLSGLDR